MPRNITDNLTNRIKNLGIEIKTNVEFGKDINLNELKNEYEAIFLAVGADIPSTYKLTDKECNTIYKSNYILKEYNAKRVVENLGDVVIIGGRKCCNRLSKSCNENGGKICDNSI